MQLVKLLWQLLRFGKPITRYLHIEIQIIESISQTILNHATLKQSNYATCCRLLWGQCGLINELLGNA